jgi:hypothetical protein
MSTFRLFPMVFVLAFVFVVLMVLLLGKNRKAGVGVLVGVIAVLVLVVLFVGLRVRVPHQRVAYESRDWERPSAVALVESGGSARLTTVSPIWSEGMDHEFEADVYPSKAAAVRALGPRLQGWIHQLAEDANQPLRIVLFQEENSRPLMWELEHALEKALPGVPCAIEVGSRNINGDEIGITLHPMDLQTVQPAPWGSSESSIVSGRVVANARHRERGTSVTQSFSEKPWVENFAGFVNERSDRQFLIARSRDACTSENEARRQAEEDACAQLQQRLGQIRPAVPGQLPPTVTPTDLVRGGFIADQFVQSFDGMAGRVWRQAMLVSTSPGKLATLGDRLQVEVRHKRYTWARMIASTLGVFVVIVVTYFFLNMATRGYYDWSLRIAGLVLAIVAVIFIFLLA